MVRLGLSRRSICGDRGLARYDVEKQNCLCDAKKDLQPVTRRDDDPLRSTLEHVLSTSERCLACALSDKDARASGENRSATTVE